MRTHGDQAHKNKLKTNSPSRQGNLNQTGNTIVSIMECTFEGNEPSISYSSITISSLIPVYDTTIYIPPTIIIVATVLRNNFGTGALKVYGCYQMNIVDSHFINNMQFEEGGAITLSSNNYVSTVYIVNSEFVNNTVQYGGGAIYSSGFVNLTFIDSSFVGNDISEKFAQLTSGASAIYYNCLLYTSPSPRD